MTPISSWGRTRWLRVRRFVRFWNRKKVELAFLVLFTIVCHMCQQSSSSILTYICAGHTTYCIVGSFAVSIHHNSRCKMYCMNHEVLCVYNVHWKILCCTIHMKHVLWFCELPCHFTFLISQKLCFVHVLCFTWTVHFRWFLCAWCRPRCFVLYYLKKKTGFVFLQASLPLLLFLHPPVNANLWAEFLPCHHSWVICLCYRAISFLVVPTSFQMRQHLPAAIPVSQSISESVSP